MPAAMPIRNGSPDRAHDNTLANANLSTQLQLNNGRFTVRILVDRASIEVFGNEGEAVIPSCFLPDDTKGIELFANGGAAKAVSLSIYPLRSIWTSHTATATPN